jgi:hypothetical protein
MSDTQNNGLFKGVGDEEYASTEEAKETSSDSEFPEGGTRAVSVNGSLCSHPQVYLSLVLCTLFAPNLS